jgi:hypothetical protein
LAVQPRKKRPGDLPDLPLDFASSTMPVHPWSPERLNPI